MLHGELELPEAGEMSRMIPTFRIALMLAVGFMVCAPSAEAQVDNAQAPDVIFVNGKIVTVNQDFDVVEALAVKEGTDHCPGQK